MAEHSEHSDKGLLVVTIATIVFVAVAVYVLITIFN